MEKVEAIYTLLKASYASTNRSWEESKPLYEFTLQDFDFNDELVFSTSATLIRDSQYPPRHVDLRDAIVRAIDVRAFREKLQENDAIIRQSMAEEAAIRREQYAERREMRAEAQRQKAAEQEFAAIQRAERLAKMDETIAWVEKEFGLTDDEGE